MESILVKVFRIKCFDGVPFFSSFLYYDLYGYVIGANLLVFCNIQLILKSFKLWKAMGFVFSLSLCLNLVRSVHVYFTWYGLIWIGMIEGFYQNFHKNSWWIKKQTKKKYFFFSLDIYRWFYQYTESEAHAKLMNHFITHISFSTKTIVVFVFFTKLSHIKYISVNYTEQWWVLNKTQLLDKCLSQYAHTHTQML